MKDICINTGNYYADNEFSNEKSLFVITILLIRGKKYNGKTRQKIHRSAYKKRTMFFLESRTLRIRKIFSCINGHEIQTHGSNRFLAQYTIVNTASVDISWIFSAWKIKMYEHAQGCAFFRSAL